MTSAGVRNLIGIKDLKNIAKDGEALGFYVNQSYGLLNLYGIPNESKYIIKKYSSPSPNLLDVTTPILKHQDDASRVASIKVIFFRYLPTNKICDFDVQEIYNTQGDLKTIDTTIKITNRDTILKIKTPRK